MKRLLVAKGFSRVVMYSGLINRSVIQCQETLIAEGAECAEFRQRQNLVDTVVHSAGCTPAMADRAPRGATSSCRRD